MHELDVGKTLLHSHTYTHKKHFQDEKVKEGGKKKINFPLQ